MQAVNREDENNVNVPLPVNGAMVTDRLDRLGVEYTLYNHEPIYTVAEGEHLKASMPGAHCRNLFLRDKKKNCFLVVAANETEIDLKKLSDLLGAGRFSFGSPDRLWEYLKIRPGSVNPFTVINDPENKVMLYLDKVLMDADILNVHPMENDKTVGLTPAGLEKFLNDIGHQYSIIDLSAAAP